MRLLAKFFRLTKRPVFLTLRALIKTDRGIGPLTSGQPSGSNPNGANSCEDPFSGGFARDGWSVDEAMFHDLSSHREPCWAGRCEDDDDTGSCFRNHRRGSLLSPDGADSRGGADHETSRVA